MKTYYRVCFEPENLYGVIAQRTNSKKEAYRLYHKLKEEMAIRPGRVYVTQEFMYEDGSTKSQYICSYRTGKDRNGLELTKELIKEMKHMNKIYNSEYLKKKVDDLSLLELDVVHGIEVIDLSKVDAEVVSKMIIEKQQVIAGIRRQYKADLADAETISKELQVITEQLKSIEKKLKNNYKFRKRQPKEVQKTNTSEKYLKTIGINIEAYNNDDEENSINLKDLIEPLVLYKNNNTNN